MQISKRQRQGFSIDINEGQYSRFTPCALAGTASALPTRISAQSYYQFRFQAAFLTSLFIQASFLPTLFHQCRCCFSSGLFVTRYASGVVYAH